MANKLDLQNGYGCNEEQIAVFEETFQILDKDSNGFITLQEIKEVMNSLGKHKFNASLHFYLFANNLLLIVPF